MHQQMAHVNDLGLTTARSCTHSILLRPVLWCPIRVYAGMGVVVVVGGRGVLLFKFTIFHSIENKVKKIFLWEYFAGGGGGGGGEPPKTPSGSAPDNESMVS